MRKITTIAVAMFIVSCSSSRTTETDQTPPKPMDVGYVWKFLVSGVKATDTATWTVVDTLNFNGRKFYKFQIEYDTVDKAYWTISGDTILSMNILKFATFEDTVVVRELLPNVGVGDTYADTVVIKPDTITLVYERHVQNISDIQVPYGNVSSAYEVLRLERYIHTGITPDTGIITSRTTYYFKPELFLIKYIDDTLKYELLEILK